MDITVSTPALLFPAISLLLLAYTNRFLALANLIRELHSKYQQDHEPVIIQQLHSLRYRVNLIKIMQAYGVASLFLCTISMFSLFLGWDLAGKVIFAISLVMMMLSLAVSFREIQVSIDALNLRLSDLEEKK